MDVPLVQNILHGNRRKDWIKYSHELLAQCTYKYANANNSKVSSKLQVDAALEKLNKCIQLRKGKVVHSFEKKKSVRENVYKPLKSVKTAI